jgi:exonuclease VII large subunit
MRGYSIIEKSGKTLKSIYDLKKGDHVQIKMKDGQSTAKIEEVSYDEEL